MPVLETSIAVIIVGTVLLVRRVDVRLVLMLCATALFALRASQPAETGDRVGAFTGLFVEFARRMVDAKSVVPICSAMGFAYVCKLTECDAHLVHFLCRPLRHVRWLLVPGGVAAAFIVNSAIVSQTSTVSVVGPVLVPLVLAAGFSRQTAGAMLLLGGSMGGELFNPASVEVLAIHGVTNVPATDIVHRIVPYNLLACGTTLLVFWLLTFLRERRTIRPIATANGSGGDECAIPPGDDVEDHAKDDTAQVGTLRSALSMAPAAVGRINYFKAAMPLVPIFLLLVVRRIPWIQHHVLPEVLRPEHPHLPEEIKRIAEQIAIATAMLIGVTAAALTDYRKVGRVASSFFEGAGFAYIHVISVIITAQVFAEGLRVNGLIELLTAGLKEHPRAVTAASVVVPWLLATIAGTAVGTAPMVIAVLLPVAMGAAPGGAGSPAAQAAAMRVGALNAVAAQFGRTNSPVAPVVLMCGVISHSRSTDLLKRIVPALLAGGVALLIAGILSH